MLVVNMLVNLLFASTNTFFDQFKYAYDRSKPFPLVSLQQSSFNLTMAYQLQAKWAEFLNESYEVIGYKSDLISVSSQKKYNVNSPVSGVLFSDHIYQNFDIIKKSGFQSPSLEIEIGFYINKTLTKPIKSRSALRSIIGEIVCVVDIPDINVENRKSLSLVDLVSINLGSKGLILGEPLSLSVLDRPFAISMTHNKKEIQSFDYENLLDIQLDYLMWLVDHLIETKGKIEKGSLLVTGGLNENVELKKGQYIINFGDASSILFKVI